VAGSCFFSLLISTFKCNFDTMKRFIFSLTLITYYFLAFGQTEAQKFKDRQLNDNSVYEIDLKDKLAKYDFSPLFTQTENSVVYGFIGDNYQRIRIKFISVKKDSLSPDTYSIYGKSMVKSNICEFHGTFTISNIRRYKKTSYGVDDEYKNKGIKGQFVILGNYSLSENKDQNYPGVFKGAFKTAFYLDKNDKVCYDDIDIASDGYTNNQFVGQWAAYNGKLIKNCNWGDYRVPGSPGLDIGAGEFSPADIYLKYGWQSRRDLMESPNDKSAKQKENAKWWE
jgi:hypothetical protein